MQLFSEDPEEVLQDVQDPEETTRRMNILKTLLLLGLRFLGFVSFSLRMLSLTVFVSRVHEDAAVCAVEASLRRVR